ncbi:MAG: CapA family protein, partial [Faecalibacterium sp.]
MKKTNVFIISLCSILMCFYLTACSTQTVSTEPVSAVVSATTAPTATATASPSPTPEPTPIVTTVTFSASGDNLIHKSIYEDAATAASIAGNGDAYDFTYVYENVASFFADYDVNWINQETLVTDTLEPSTYPMFSTPSEIIDTLYDIGFRVFSLSNNHTYDKGATGIDATLAFWESTPEDVISVGLYDTETDENDIELQEINGITIAYVAYTFSTNGIPTPSNATKTVIYTSEIERMKEQVVLADTLADFVIVSVHWGTEDSHIVHSSQETLAQNFADWGADLIIGTHPHVLQDCAWITAEDGHQAFVAYSLGIL